MSNSKWAEEDKGTLQPPPAPTAIPRDFYGELIDKIDAMMTFAIASRHQKTIEAIGRWHKMTYGLEDKQE